VKESCISRREMLMGGIGAVAGLTLTTSCSRFGRFEPGEAHGQGFKIGVCDWTIGKRTDPGSLEMAKGLGLDGVQVDFGGGESELPLFNAELQKRFLEEAKNHQVKIGSLALGVLNGVPYKSDPRAERWVAESVDVCKAMGLTVVLVPFFGDADLRNDKQGTDVVVERLKKVSPKAEKAGVILGLESWLSAEQHLDIIDRVGSPAVQVYYDVGNSHKAGYDIYQEIRQLGKQICEFHAKDYDNLYGKGSIAFAEVRKAMDDIGYRGWIQIEGTEMPLGLEESIRYDAEYLRKLFPVKV
jgi:L-ribulose-5-phosphate 3-epimerase